MYSHTNGATSPVSRRSYLSYDYDDTLNDSNSLEDNVFNLTQKVSEGNCSI